MPPRTLLAGFLFLIFVSATVAYWWLAVHFVESTDNAYVRGDVTAISAGVGGEIIKVWVHENQRVAIGDVLVSIDAESYRARLNQVAAQLAVREAELVALDERLALQDVMAREAEAGLNLADAESVRVGKEWERVYALGGQGYAAKQGIDNTAAARRSANAGVEKARASIDAVQRRKAALKADRERLFAERDAAKAAVELTRIELRHAEVKAPVAGVVADLLAKPGLRVRDGARFLTLVPLQRLWVEANFKETQIARLLPGQQVEIRADAFPDQPLTGTVESLAPASGAEFALLPPENASGNFTKVVQRVPVRIALQEKNPLEGELRPGLSVHVSVDVHGSHTLDKSRASTEDSGITATQASRQ